jgi:hypothetical protein
MSAIGPSAHQRGGNLNWLPPLLLFKGLFTQVPGRSVLGSPYPESCIAPVLSGQDRRFRPPLLDRGSLHLVVLDGYAGK